MRYDTPGGVGAFWTYWNHGSSDIFTDRDYKAHETDYEIFATGVGQNKNVFHTANYRDWHFGPVDPSDVGFNGYSNSNYVQTKDILVSGIDYTQWHVLKIVWTPQPNGKWRTKWYVKQNQNQSYGSPIRDEIEVAPDKWMTVRFNIWSGSSSGPFGPSDFANNLTYYLDVDWIKVTKVAPVLVSVTEVSGVAAPNGKSVPDLSVIKGQVADEYGRTTQVNVVITRQSDGKKWKGYDDNFGPHGWVPASENVGTSTNYPSTQPTWTVNGLLPSVRI